MPKVFVIQEQPNHDISPAAKFGEIVVLCPPGDRNFSQQQMVDLIWNKLERDATEEDYFLLTGDPVLLAAVGFIAGTLLDGKLRLLKWNKRTMEYLPIEVLVHE